MNILAARMLLHVMSERLQRPEFQAQLANARTANMQTLDSSGHVWTLSLHEVDPAEVTDAGDLVILNGESSNTDGRLN